MNINLYDDKEILIKFIENLTSKGEEILSESLVKDIKDLCKKSPELVETAAYTLLSQLKKKHSQIRYSSVQLCDILFKRSFHFRLKILENLFEFFELTLGLKTSLPPPKSWWTKLKTLALAVLKEWEQNFGDRHPQLITGLNHLKLDYSVSLNLNTSNELTDTQRVERMLRLKKIRKQKFLNAINEFNEMKNELIELDLKMNSCFDILVPVIGNDFNNVKSIDQNNQSYLQHGLASKKYKLVINIKETEDIEETQDNEILFDELRGCYKLAQKKCQVLKELINIMTKLDDEELKELQRISIQNIIEHLQKLRDNLKKCDDLKIFEKIDQDSDSDSDSEEFEEVPLNHSDELFGTDEFSTDEDLVLNQNHQDNLVVEETISQNGDDDSNNQSSPKISSNVIPENHLIQASSSSSINIPKTQKPWESMDEDIRISLGLPDPKNKRELKSGVPSRLINLKKESDTSKNRIKKKLSNPSARKRIRENVQEMNELNKRNRDINRW